MEEDVGQQYNKVLKTYLLLCIDVYSRLCLNKKLSKTHWSVYVYVLQNIPALPCGKALYSYEGKEPGDLQFSKGDIIILRRKVDDNWYHGELNGCHGFLPASYIQLLRPLSQTPPQGKALYDFEVKDKDQDKDCLAFSKVKHVQTLHTSTCRAMAFHETTILTYVASIDKSEEILEIDLQDYRSKHLPAEFNRLDDYLFDE